MENKAVRNVIIFILVLMGIIEIGSTRKDIDLDGRHVVLVIIVASSIACFFFLKLFFHRTEGKKWMETHNVLKSTLISIFFILVIKAFTYGTISVVYDDISELFTFRSHRGTTQSIPYTQTGKPMEESFDSTSNTYYNHTYKFSFKIPEGWKRYDTYTKNRVFGIYREEKYCSISIIRNANNRPSLPPSACVDKYIKDMEEDIEKMKDVVKKVSYQKINVFGLESIRIHIITAIPTESGILDYHNIFTFAITKASYFSVIVVVPIVFYEDNPDYYDNLFNNFNITD